jgi:hypothetical protein
MKLVVNMDIQSSSGQTNASPGYINKVILVICYFRNYLQRDNKKKDIKEAEVTLTHPADQKGIFATLAATIKDGKKERKLFACWPIDDFSKTVSCSYKDTGTLQQKEELDAHSPTNIALWLCLKVNEGSAPSQ